MNDYKQAIDIWLCTNFSADDEAKHKLISYGILFSKIMNFKPANNCYGDPAYLEKTFDRPSIVLSNICHFSIKDRTKLVWSRRDFFKLFKLIFDHNLWHLRSKYYNVLRLMLQPWTMVGAKIKHGMHIASQWSVKVRKPVELYWASLFVWTLLDAPE